MNIIIFLISITLIIINILFGTNLNIMNKIEQPYTIGISLKTNEIK